MRTAFTLLLILAISASAGTLLVTSDLQKAIGAAAAGDTLYLASGTYSAVAHAYDESLCGNCENAQTEVNASFGFKIDKALRIVGSHPDSCVLITNAGYGVLYENSRGSVLERVTITGGVRDADGRATDAGVVLKNSTVKFLNCGVRDNTHYFDSTIVGIGGIMLREGSEAWITKCKFINNSWDGIALYRGGQAWITDCVIDSGRGVGIGVTWDGVAICERNEISHYWKGLGSFGTSTVVARNNLIHDNLGWGLIASGESSLIAENNTVAQNGNCGIAIWNQGCRGRLVNNISALNGWRKQWVCPCVGFWNQESDTANWVIENNLLWNNTAGEMEGISPATFTLADPLFADTLSFKLLDTSPAMHSGSETLRNPDGTRSHIGHTGGPAAR